MFTLVSWRRVGFVCAVLLFVVACDVAFACPNCRDALAGDPQHAGLARGFFWSILFMVSMPFLILGGLGSYFYWEICRARRATAAAPVVGQGSPFAEGELSAFESHEIEAGEPVEVG
jgi:hypothetical protein